MLPSTRIHNGRTLLLAVTEVAKESKKGNPVRKARQKGQSGPSLTLTRTGLATFYKVQPFLSI